MRGSPTGFFQHLCVGQREKFRVPLWSPRECVDPIKSEHVIDAENVEDSPDAAHSLSPPGEILRPHRRPVINWDPPVLSPLDRELVIFEIRFRWRAPRPIEMEDVPLSENIGAVITDTEGNVAHESDLAFLSKFSHLTPLLVGDPLHVGKEFLAPRKLCPHLCRLFRQPGARCLRVAMFPLPFVPRFALPVQFHENAKK